MKDQTKDHGPTLAALIRQRLIHNKQLGDLLAKYGGRPAIFYQMAPDDTDAGWNCENQYPRLVFLTDSRQEAEHDQSGTLVVDIICSQTGTAPEKIQPIIQDTLAGVIFSPKPTGPTILKWRDASVFEEQTPAALLIGVRANFELIDLPDMTTTEPDPVAAFYRYLEAWDPDVVTVNGRWHMPVEFKPTREHPAVWARNLGSSVDRITNTVVWLNASIKVHLFAPGLAARTGWLHQLANELAVEGEMTAEDGAPIFIQNIKGNAAADEFEGQLKIDVQYGILRRRDDIPRPIQLARANVNIKELNENG